MNELVDDAIWRLRRTDGSPLLPSTGTGELTGLTVAVKDVFEVEGFAMGAGNPVWLAERTPARHDSAAVAALREAHPYEEPAFDLYDLVEPPE